MSKTKRRPEDLIASLYSMQFYKKKKEWKMKPEEQEKLPEKAEIWPDIKILQGSLSWPDLQAPPSSPPPSPEPMGDTLEDVILKSGQLEDVSEEEIAKFDSIMENEVTFRDFVEGARRSMHSSLKNVASICEGEEQPFIVDDARFGTLSPRSIVYRLK